MKIILTEVQYKLLETILNEISQPFSSKIEKGGKIDISQKDKKYTMEVVDVHGGQFIETKANNITYIIDVLKAFDSDKNTLTFIKNGKFEEAKINDKGKIISPPKIVGGNKIIVKEIKEINIYDSSKNIVDKITTSIGDEEEKQKGAKAEEKLKKRIEKEKQIAKKLSDKEKELYTRLLSDPDLKKAYYHQPSIFGGLLNYGKAKGIGPAHDLLDKYLTKKRAEKTTKDKDFLSYFKTHSVITYELVAKPIIISHGNQDFKLKVGPNYQARYRGDGIFTSKLDGILYKIKLRKNLGEDIYSGTIKINFKEGDEIISKSDEIVIKVNEYK